MFPVGDLKAVGVAPGGAVVVAAGTVPTGNVVTAPVAASLGAPAATVGSGEVVSVVVGDAVFLPPPEPQLARAAAASTPSTTAFTSSAA